MRILHVKGRACLCGHGQSEVAWAACEWTGSKPKAAASEGRMGRPRKPCDGFLAGWGPSAPGHVAGSGKLQPYCLSPPL
jgi:hypothetical protein